MHRLSVVSISLLMLLSLNHKAYRPPESWYVCRLLRLYLRRPPEGTSHNWIPPALKNQMLCHRYNLLCICDMQKYLCTDMPQVLKSLLTQVTAESCAKISLRVTGSSRDSHQNWQHEHHECRKLLPATKTCNALHKRHSITQFHMATCC